MERDPRCSLRSILNYRAKEGGTLSRKKIQRARLGRETHFSTFVAKVTATVINLSISLAPQVDWLSKEIFLSIISQSITQKRRALSAK